MASTITRQPIDANPGEPLLILTNIESGSLILRLWQQLSEAGAEIARDPAGFIRESLRGYSGDAKRRRLMYTGAVISACIYALLLALFLVMGFRRGFAPRHSDEGRWVVQMLTPPDYNAAPPDKANNANGTAGGHLGKGSGGGGGGGQGNPLPASKGVEPRMLPIPQIVAPKLEDVHPATLPVPVTIVGPQEPPPPPGPLGLSKGAEGPPSPGPGSGEGLGAGHGSGAGNGSGPGAGPGKGGGRGGGLPGLPNSHYDGTLAPMDWRLVNNKPGFKKFEWTYREHPVITPEAAAEQADGDVLLRATFHANGTITDIEVINPVAHMTQSAIEALKHCRFRPATFNGEPITLTHVLVIINVNTGVSAR